MKNISKIKQRLLQFIEKKELNKNKFYNLTGVSNGTLDKKSKLSTDTVEKIVKIFPDINLHWLITGEKKNAQNGVVEDPKNSENYKAKFFECTENYMKLNEELLALKKSNANLKKDDKQIFDKS